MLHHLEVSNFRALEKFRMEHLGRINLLVGTNNCGKTSVLEAIRILMAQEPWVLWFSQSMRGETYDDGDASEIAIEHLFYGHRMDLDAMFAIEGRNGETERRVEARVEKRDPKDPLQLRLQLSRPPRSSEIVDPTLLSSLVLSMAWSRGGARQQMQLPITKRGGLSPRDLEISSPPDEPVFFIGTEGLDRDMVPVLLEEAMLTPEEETVLTVLRTIEPDIERIVPVGIARRTLMNQRRGGVAVKLAGQRVPIGSLGDGIWRILGIALALVRARGGTLLVDEIDTGLHYSVLERMWHLVNEAASRLDVQVFATTHSRDCYESLAAIAHPGGHDVTIQRIERGKPLAVAFPEAEILQAAKRGIEVR